MKKETAFWIILTASALLFSSFLMWQTFSYDAASSSMMIAPKAWSDFGAHIPLIRSFSLGHNWPPQSPLYPGLPIQYHFLFYFMVGMLEHVGLRVDWALNIPSVIGMTGLIVLIALVAYRLWKRFDVALLSVLFFCLNSSLAFLPFFRRHPLSLHTIMDIVTNSRFAAFGPWDGQEISAFWTMNIYTNQRHLGLSYALVLLLIAIILRNKKTKWWHRTQTIVVVLGMSILLFMNQAAAAIAALWLGWIWIIRKETRIQLISAALLCIPTILYYRHTVAPAGTIVFDPGYLAHTPLSLKTIVGFWWQNLGLSLIMIPFGWLVAPKKMKLMMGIPLLALFIIPNLFRFSPDMINNHKFFNFFIIMGNMLTAYGVVWLWQTMKTHTNSTTIRWMGHGLVIGLIFFLTLSGVIDLFPIFNESRAPLVDLPANQDAQFFLTHTQPTDVILNSTWFYHPASLAGRKIFSGYTYFTWSYGYDQGKREDEQKSIYEAENKTIACNFLMKYHLRYIELNDMPEQFLKPNMSLFKKEFIEIYANPGTGVHVYDAAVSCSHL